MKNVITYLKTLWSRVAGSQRNDVEFDRRLTVGSPSGFTINWTLKLVSVLVLVLTIGIGNVWGITVSDISTSAATTLTDGGEYVVATAYNGTYLTSNVSSSWGGSTTSAGSAAIFTAHGSASGFYLTCSAGRLVTATSKTFSAYDEESSNNLSLSAEGKIQNSSNTSWKLQLGTSGFRWYSSDQTYAYLFAVSSGPTITTSSTMSTFGCNLSTGVPTVQNFSVSGSNLSANLTVTPPSGYEICLSSDGTYQTTAISLTPSTGTVSSTTIYVRLKSANAAGSYSGNIACASTGATTQNVAISGSTPFTVTWKANNSLVATTYVTYATGTGTALGTLASDPDPEDYSCDGRAFYGWYDGASYSDEDDAPATITTSTKITTDKTYNAVFAYAEVGDPTFSKYELVTSAPSDWSGKYLLSTGTYTATGAYSSKHLTRTTLTPGTTEYTSYEFVLTKVGTKYTIKFPGSSTEYLGYSDGTNFKKGNATQANACKAWKWNPSTSGIANDSISDRKLGDGGADIRPYSSTPSSGWVKLYKRVEAPSVSYSYYSTSCVDDKCVTPSFGKSAGTYIGTQSVTITCATTGSTIYYTTDNSTPSSSSTEYTGAISVSSTTTIKAIAVKDGLTDSDVASATYTIRSCKEYSLVTDASALGIGDKIVILDNSGTYAMSTTQNTKNRGVTTDFVLNSSTVRVPDVGEVQPITLEAYADGYWYFKVGDDSYLAATGTSEAQLKSQTKSTVNTNSTGKWSIALVSSVFTVKTNDGKTYNTMRYNYNSGSPIFNCYDGDKQTAIKVYAYQNTSPTIETNTASLSGFSATYGGSASDAQNIYVSGRNLNGNITVTPPTGYEIKKSGDASYSSSAITLTPSSKKVSVTLNVRLAAGNNAGNYNGNLTLVGYNSEASTNVALTGTVAKMTPVITFTLNATSALANTAVGYTLSSTSSATALTFSYKRGGSAVSSMITNDTENKTISISQAGTYTIQVNQAGDDNHNAAAQAEQVLTITVRDVFKDMVNGYSDINGDDTGSGITTPTFAEMEDGEQNTCHSTTRYLIGWIKAADLTTIYSGETGYLEDAAKYEANKDKIVAPGTETTASGVTWYAAWGEEK